MKDVPLNKLDNAKSAFMTETRAEKGAMTVAKAACKADGAYRNRYRPILNKIVMATSVSFIRAVWISRIVRERMEEHYPSRTWIASGSGGARYFIRYSQGILR